MGTNSLRQLLRNLCNGTQWKYAVFWKLKHRSRMLLTWEDGYCDYPKPRDTLSDNICFNDTTGVLSFCCEIGAHSGSSAGYSIGLAVANMSCLLYSLGEGVVGKVAFTGKNSWFFANDFNSKFVPEYPDEWQLQFSAGIKTILLVPVVPHGVVQLGSVEMVMEDPTLVAHVKDLFNMLQDVNVDSVTFNPSGDLLGPPSSFSSPLFGDYGCSSAITSNPLNLAPPKPLKKDVIVLDTNQITMNRPSVIGPNLSPLFIQDNVHDPQQNMPHAIGVDRAHSVDGRLRETTGCSLPWQPSEVSSTPNQFMNPNHLEVNFGDMSSFSCHEEQLHVSPCNLINQHSFAEQSSMLNSWEDHLEQKIIRSISANLANEYDFCSFGHAMDQIFVNMATEEDNHNIASDTLSFPVDSELHKALGPAPWKGGDIGLLDVTISGEDKRNSSSPICDTCESNGLFLDRDSLEHLLHAVVGNVCGGSYENVSTRSNKIRSPSSSSGQFTTSCQTEIRSEGSALVENDLGVWNHGKSAFVSRGEVFTSSPTGSISKGASTVMDEKGQKIGYAQSRKGPKPYQVSRRKAGAGAGTGDTQRQRPRDRQMIQDRVKELREMVPNGAKCSIDALLDRTVKHMLFLQSVTNQAEKLRHYKYSKAPGNENLNSPINHQKDASWAFEIGGQSRTCPIIVEDLDHPGHMLVEMLCEEHGLFLEIAQVIRRLKLTILKGVMESRSDKIWAHFIIEASRGFQRMDILWPLMQLLQRHGNQIASKF
ncbi:transcription factor LHW-like isoform X2 [Tasmannia lanceolata]|uniref:transcription factor LHW-like isoform X2 n=1 Tax=Tasmannia lanceolata TaxID=3420 RepID=UPI0040648A20